MYFIGLLRELRALIFVTHLAQCLGREVGLAGMGWRGGEKMQTTVIEQ